MFCLRGFFLTAYEILRRKYSMGQEIVRTKVTLKVTCGNRKALLESLRQALAAGRRFDAIMRNTFRRDRLTLEAWKRACRVPRAPRTKPKEVPDPAKP